MGCLYEVYLVDKGLQERTGMLMGEFWLWVIDDSTLFVVHRAIGTITTPYPDG